MSGDHEHGEGAAALKPSDFGSAAEYVAAVMALPNDPAHGDNPAMAAEHAALLDLVPRSESTFVAIRDGSWFDPATWFGGKVPGEGAKVLIPEAISVSYDAVGAASVFTVRVDGKLLFATDHDTRLEVDTLVVDKTGLLRVGTHDHPVGDGVTAAIVIAKNGAIDVRWDPMLLSRGVISHGSVEIHGQEKAAFLKLAVDPMRGDTILTLAGDAEANGWKVGDTIVLTGTHIIPDLWDGEKLVDQGTQDEVLTIVAIDGNAVTLDRALSHDHDTPRDDLKAYAANYTRNVRIETEDADSVPVSERGHVMFMHNPSIDVQYAEFHALGRTDKSVRAVDVAAVPDIASDTNVKGRYALHLHQTGVDPDGQQATLAGNAVWGSPGWGIVQHGSSAIIEGNATFNTFGAGYVAETGDETGLWLNNIAILAPGVGWGHIDKDVEDVEAFDLARSGDGFWFQGRLVAAEGNVAAGVNEGFVYMHRGGNTRVDADTLAQPEILHGLQSTTVNEPPIGHFVNNEVLASSIGLIVIKANPTQDHDVRSVFERFTAWEVDTGVHLEYTAHYTLIDFDLVGTSYGTRYNKGFKGIDIASNTFDIVINGAEISNFQDGIVFSRNLTGAPVIPADDLNYVIIDLVTSDISGDTIKNFDPGRDLLLTGADLNPGGTTLALDFASIPVWSMDWPGGRVVNLGGIKTDSIGSISYANGSETFTIGQSEMSGLLSHQGYYTTDDGRKIVILEEYFSDRAMGEIFKVGIPIQLADNVPLTKGQWFLQDGDAISLGRIDLASRAPTAHADSATTQSGTSVTIAVLANDHDPEGDPLALDGLTSPDHGFVRANEDGSVTYTPFPKFEGTDHFHYWVTDGNGEYTRQTVTVTVEASGHDHHEEGHGHAPTGILLSGASVREGAPAGFAIGVLSAIDADHHDTSTYALLGDAGGFFAIVGNQLIVKRSPDYETAATHTVGISVTDSAGLTFSRDVTVSVVNVAPGAPVDVNPNANRVIEGAKAGTQVGITAAAVDPGGGRLTYALSDDAGGRFAIDPRTGVVTVAKAELLDFETAGGHTIRVTASDPSGAATAITMTVTVTDKPGLKIKGSGANDTIGGKKTLAKAGSTDENDIFYGKGGNDTLHGGLDADLLSGGPGKDKLYGGGGDDLLYGGAGRDKLHGGAGADTFSFQSLKDSPAKGCDAIGDFNSRDGDRVDLSAIDANANARGNQAFAYIGEAAFSGRAGELRFAKQMLTGDVDGDGRADFKIKMPGVVALGADDLILA